VITPARNQAIDFFRGFALFMILVDHIPGSPLSNLTLRNFALCDATEIFVFLSGLSCGLAYLKIESKNGTRSAALRMARRSFTLYLAHIAIALSVLVSGVVLLCFALDKESQLIDISDEFLSEPLRCIARIAKLTAQPPLTDVLPLYVFFIFVSPLYIETIKRWPQLALGASALVWSFAVPLRLAVSGLLFNPFAWQLVFALGIAVAIHRDLLLARLDARSTLLCGSAKLIVLLSVLLVTSWRYPEVHDNLLPLWLRETIYPISKPDLDLLRLLNFLALAWLTRFVLNAVDIHWQKAPFTWVTVVGRHGLPCFAMGILLSLWAGALAHNARIIAANWIADLLAIALLIGFAMLYERRERPARSRAAAKAAANDQAQVFGPPRSPLSD